MANANEDDNKFPNAFPIEPTYDIGTEGGSSNVLQVWVSNFEKTAFWTITHRVPIIPDENAASIEELARDLQIELVDDESAEVFFRDDFIDGGDQLNYYYSVSCRDEEDCNSGIAETDLKFEEAVECPICDDVDPSMLVTVTGASGTIVWLGETWVLPADSGVEKCVCPTIYNRIPALSTGVAREHWTFNDDLRLNVLNYYYSISGYFGSNLIEVIASRDFYYWYYSDQHYTTSDLGLGLVAFKLDRNNPVIPDSFFTSYTNGGITYSWKKGENWQS